MELYLEVSLGDGDVLCTGRRAHIDVCVARIAEWQRPIVFPQYLFASSIIIIEF